MGNRIFANVVMVGFFTGITSVISAESVKAALPDSVPERFIDVNIKAFERGYDYAIEVLEKEKQTTKAKA